MNTLLFVTLMAPKGRGADAIKHLKDLRAPEGIKILHVFFTFGRYDGLIIFEAPNETAAMKFVMELGFATEYTMETLVAVPDQSLPHQ